MCTCYCLHHHHIPPCLRPVSIAFHYQYCSSARLDPATNAVVSPCPALLVSGSPTSYSCADASSCLVSAECSSGACRLEDLRGSWACCRCGGGGNGSRWCRHRMKGSPDTFCYHTVCASCTPDC